MDVQNGSKDRSLFHFDTYDHTVLIKTVRSSTDHSLQGPFTLPLKLNDFFKNVRYKMLVEPTFTVRVLQWFKNIRPICSRTCSRTCSCSITRTEHEQKFCCFSRTRTEREQKIFRTPRTRTEQERKKYACYFIPAWIAI